MTDDRKANSRWTLTAAELAELAEGEIHGSSDVEITGIAPLGQAAENEVAYVADQKYVEKAGASGASVLITMEQIEDFEGTQIVCSDPELAFSKVLASLHDALYPRPGGISDHAIISEEATLGENVSVGANAVIQKGARIGDGVTIYPQAFIGHDATVGAGTTIHPHATICARVQIGQRCVVRASAVVGGEGFRYIQRGGKHVPMPHVGSVRIGDDVDVGRLASIDRGLITDTEVGNDVKIGEHCDVAHNCKVEDHCILVAYTRMGGSCTIRRGCILGADVRVRDHTEIGEGCNIGASTGVARDVKPGQTMWGMPARPLREQQRIYAIQGRLPDMHRRIGTLEKEIDELRQQLQETE